jgi:hypothetical protein
MHSRFLLAALFACSCSFDYGKLDGKAKPGDGGIDSMAIPFDGASAILDGALSIPDGSGMVIDSTPRAADGSAETKSTDGSTTAARDSRSAVDDAPMDIGDVGASPADSRAEASDSPSIDGTVDAPAGSPDALAVGATCTSAAQCERGFCVDGVCCENACTGVCTTCNLPENPGRCSPVPAGQDPRDNCPQDLASSCGRDGTCDGAGKCRLLPDGTECASATCTAGTQSSARTCDGSGTCRPATTLACTPYACKGVSCVSSCTSDSDCASSATCQGSVCKKSCNAQGGTVVPHGQTCPASSGAQYLCQDGTCTAIRTTGVCVLTSGQTYKDGSYERDFLVPGELCPSGGTCRDGACCLGCWDGSTCLAGNSVAACGTNGATCDRCTWGCTTFTGPVNNPCGGDYGVTSIAAYQPYCGSSGCYRSSSVTTCCGLSGTATCSPEAGCQ